MACASSDIHDTLNVLIALCRIVRPCHQWQIQKFFKGGPGKNFNSLPKNSGDLFFSLKSQKKFQLPSKIFGGPFFSPKSENNSSTLLNTIKTILRGWFRGGSGLLKGGPHGEKIYLYLYNCSNMRLQGP